jgi:hypothetical protein
VGDKGTPWQTRFCFERPEAVHVKVAHMLTVRREHRHLGDLVETRCGKQRHEEAWLVRPVADMDIEETSRSVMWVTPIRGMGGTTQ